MTLSWLRWGCCTVVLAIAAQLTALPVWLAFAGQLQLSSHSDLCDPACRVPRCCSHSPEYCPLLCTVLTCPPPSAVLACVPLQLATDIPDLRIRLGIGDTEVFGGQGFSLAIVQLRVRGTAAWYLVCSMGAQGLCCGCAASRQQAP